MTLTKKTLIKHLRIELIAFFESFNNLKDLLIFMLFHQRRNFKSDKN